MSEMSLYQENARELSAAMRRYAVILLCTNWRWGGEGGGRKQFVRGNSTRLPTLTSARDRIPCDEADQFWK